MPLVDIQDLWVSFSQYGGQIDAVRGVSCSVNQGKSLGIVSCSTLLRLLPATANVSATTMTLDGINILKAGKG
ncbi:MAG: hypothetical protein MO846_09040 [Candidatus Devosia symbiotica]|nr:hypothetical protein [Candidatus Devosia symbiotica]